VFCDFNAGVYPAFNALFDVVVCSGVLEYIRRPKDFLERVTRLGTVTMLSYHPFGPGDSKWNRLAFNWVNHFTQGDLHTLFDQCGLNWEIVHGRATAEPIYALQRRA
jgi:hypothetical protein